MASVLLAVADGPSAVLNEPLDAALKPRATASFPDATAPAASAIAPALVACERLPIATPYKTEAVESGPIAMVLVPEAIELIRRRIAYCPLAVLVLPMEIELLACRRATACRHTGRARSGLTGQDKAVLQGQGESLMFDAARKSRRCPLMPTPDTPHDVPDLPLPCDLPNSEAATKAPSASFQIDRYILFIFFLFNHYTHAILLSFHKNN